MKKISIYTKTGIQAATTYYRVYQYLNNIAALFHFHKMLSDKMYQRVMPIYTKPIIIKIIIFIYTYFRVLYQLLSDLIWRPDFIILSRRLINRYLPFSYKILLKLIIKRGAKIIWDFDDNIIEMKEVTKKDFDFLCDISSTIIIATPIIKNLVPLKYQSKIVLLPTTDGDMNSRLSSDVMKWRLERLKKELIIVWTGTSVSLEFVRDICHHIENAASKIKHIKVILKIICNLPLIYKPNNFELINIKWERELAINELLHSHVGIMPLDNSEKSRGKGGFKLIQYLSIGLPVIGSDIGINSSIIDKNTGFAISTLESRDWVTAICNFAKKTDMWKDKSKHCIEKWNSHYSFISNKEVWEKLLA